MGSTGILSYDSKTQNPQKVGGGGGGGGGRYNDTACSAFTTVRDIPDILGSLFLIDLLFRFTHPSNIPSPPPPPPPVIRRETAH